MVISKKESYKICPNPPITLTILYLSSSKCGDFFGNFSKSSFNHVYLGLFSVAKW
jgi:hypothetical protein